MDDRRGVRRARGGTARGRTVLAVMVAWAALVALAVAGCGGESGAPQDGVAQTRTDGTGDSGLLEPQAAPDKKLSFVGAGPGNGALGGDRCVFWTWDSGATGDVLTDGVAFVVTRVQIDPHSFDVTRSGCEPGAVPWCEDGTRLTSDAPTCQFGVEPSDDATGVAQATLFGRLDCGPATVERCDAIVTAVRDAPVASLTIDLGLTSTDGDATSTDGDDG